MWNFLSINLYLNSTLCMFMWSRLCLLSGFKAYRLESNKYAVFYDFHVLGIADNVTRLNWFSYPLTHATSRRKLHFSLGIYWFPSLNPNVLVYFGPYPLLLVLALTHHLVADQYISRFFVFSCISLCLSISLCFFLLLFLGHAACQIIICCCFCEKVAWSCWWVWCVLLF